MLPPGNVPKQERETAKRVTYGIIYGLTPFGLANALQEQNVDIASAGKLIKSFLAHFSEVKGFMDR